jgi:hypothetical protein
VKVKRKWEEPGEKIATERAAADREAGQERARGQMEYRATPGTP